VATTRVVDGNRDIYLTLNNTNITRRLTDHPEADFMPIWSPDGQWIAFESHRNRVNDTMLPAIYIVRPDGTQLRKMGDVPGYAFERRITWSPDSQHIEVFYQPTNGSGLRFVANVYDGAWINDVYTEAAYAPSMWSSDGQWRLVPYIQSNRSGQDLYRQRMAGGERELVLDMTNYDEYAWSPDGQWILFSAFANNSVEIFRIRPDGSDLQNLTNSPYHQIDPLWSPDGQWIYFLQRSGPANTLNLYRMRSDGTEMRPVTSVAGNITGLYWSPDQKWILYTLEPVLVREWHLYRALPDGKSAQEIAEGVGNIIFIAWSPDGQSLAYSATGNVRQNIFIASLDGTAPRQLTHSTLPDIAPFWSPDGQSLIFRRQSAVYQIHITTGQLETLSDFHLAVDFQTHAHYWSPLLPEYGLIGGWTPNRPDCNPRCVAMTIGLSLAIPALYIFSFQRPRQLLRKTLHPHKFH
jgi:TolB protein